MVFQLQGDPLQVPPCWSCFNVIHTHFTDMNSEVKAKWLEALRSGKYRQSRYRLRSLDNGFCCLGVLCDIYTKEVGGSWKLDKAGLSDSYEMVSDSGHESVTSELPSFVRNWADLEWFNPQVHVAKGECDFVPATLAELNDEGRSFKEIADIIDHQL